MCRQPTAFFTLRTCHAATQELQRRRTMQLLGSLQASPQAPGQITGVAGARSALLDALDVREVLVERERISGEEEATRQRETGRAGNIWAGPEYCLGKDSEPVEQDGDPGRAASDGWMPSGWSTEQGNCIKTQIFSPGKAWGCEIFEWTGGAILRRRVCDRGEICADSAGVFSAAGGGGSHPTTACQSWP
ncbi:UNVERIFIED_CONTAM: hypothetical protein FKN15_071160 [Acipenser sinensis]